MKKRLVWGTHTYVMGIINLTPDSFSGDGLANSEDIVTKAVRQARQMIADGAEILDIGAESSRPGAKIISVEEELKRLMPALMAIRNAEKHIILSVDTYKSEVAEQALLAGADWVNDIWGLRYDNLMAGIVHQHAAGVIIMHNGRKLEKEIEEITHENPLDTVQRVKKSFAESLAIAKQAGIANNDIILDVGIGFGKTVEENLELINRLDEFKTLGFPLLVGPSRKSFIGTTLDLPPDQRLEGTAAAVAISIVRGANIIRVHDVREMKRVVKMCDAILSKTG